MTKPILLLASAVAVVACGPSDDRLGVAPCTTLQNGDERCDGTWVVVCNGTAWVQETDCAASDALCRQDPYVATAACGASGQEGDPCDSTSECATGLDCYEWIAGEYACLDLCEPGDASGCLDGGAASVCLELAIGGGLCLPSAHTGELCFVDEQCVGAEEFCFGFTFDAEGLVGTCTRSCPYEDINHGQGATCDAGTVCLASEYHLDFQEGSVACSDTDTSACNAAEGYTCIDFGGATGQRCAREIGQCGHALPAFAELPASMPPESERCGVVYASGDNRNFCGFADPTATAFAYCYPGLFSTEPASEGLCFAVCGGLNGEPDASCGAGYTCTRPDDATRAFSFDLQLTDGGATRVACNPSATSPDAPCDVASGYACEYLSSGSFCAIPSKMCTPL